MAHEFRVEMRGRIKGFSLFQLAGRQGWERNPSVQYVRVTAVDG
jgi:hypothetical protein